MLANTHLPFDNRPARIRATRVFELDFTGGSGAGKNGARCGGAQGAADQAALLGALDERVRAGGGRFALEERFKQDRVEIGKWFDEMGSGLGH